MAKKTQTPSKYETQPEIAELSSEDVYHAAEIILAMDNQIGLDGQPTDFQPSKDQISWALYVDTLNYNRVFDVTGAKVCDLIEIALDEAGL